MARMPSWAVAGPAPDTLVNHNNRHTTSQQKAISLNELNFSYWPQAKFREERASAEVEGIADIVGNISQPGIFTVAVLDAISG